MEFLPGGNLKALIQRFGSLPESWVRFYSAELVLAISHLHSLNVLYRDIKPHNVMLDGYGHLVLIDFGLSKQNSRDDDGRGAMSLVGTPDYSAPEVLKTGVYRLSSKKAAKKGAKLADSEVPENIGYGKSADWWSVGVMIYEMIHGRPPFRGRDLRETYKNVLFMDIVFPKYPYAACTVGKVDEGESIPTSALPGSDVSVIPPSNVTNGAEDDDEEEDGDGRQPQSVFSQCAQSTLSRFLRRSPDSRLGSCTEHEDYSPDMPILGAVKALKAPADGAPSDSTSTGTGTSTSSTPFQYRQGAVECVQKIPKDIMCSPFFADYYTPDDWVKIYSRSTSGPWLPPPDVQLVRKGFRGYAIVDKHNKEKKERRRAEKVAQRLKKKSEEQPGVTLKSSSAPTAATNGSDSDTHISSNANNMNANPVGDSSGAGEHYYTGFEYESPAVHEGGHASVSGDAEEVPASPATGSTNGKFNVQASTMGAKERGHVLASSVGDGEEGVKAKIVTFSGDEATTHAQSGAGTGTHCTPSSPTTPIAATPNTPGTPDTIKSPTFNTPNDTPRNVPSPTPKLPGDESSTLYSEVMYSDVVMGASEVLAMRDSLVAGPGRPEETLVQDWSFVDEAALLSASQVDQKRSKSSKSKSSKSSRREG